MSIFDLLGSAGAGYTRGLAQGEQAKISLLQQQKGNEFRQQGLDLQRDQLDLQKYRAQKDAERALGESRDRIRELGIKAAVASLDNYNNPQFAADHDAQAQKAGLESALQVKGNLVAWLQKTMSGEDAGEFPYPKALQKIAAQETQGQLQGPAQGQPTTPQGPMRDTGDLYNALRQTPIAGPVVQSFATPSADGQSSVPPDFLKQFFGGVDAQLPPTDVQRPKATPGFVPQPPKTAAEIALKGAQGEKARSGVAYDEARTKSEELHQPNIAGLDTSLIGLRGAQTKAANATAAATPVRVANDTKRALDSIRKTDETIRNNKANNELMARRVAVSEQANAILGDLRRMQTVKTGQEAADLEVKIRRLADSLPPDQAKMMNAIASKMTVYDQLQGKWVPNPDVDGLVDQAAQVMEALSKMPQPSAAAGGTTGTGGAIQGAPSNAALSTQNGTQSKGPAGTNHTATQGNYKASWQVNRGAGQGTGKALTPAEVEAHAKDPETRKAVEQVFGNPGEMKRVRGTLSPQGRQVWDRIMKDMTKKPKAQKAKTQPSKPQTPAPNLMTAPRR